MKKRKDDLYQLKRMVEINGVKKAKIFYGKSKEEAYRKYEDFKQKKKDGRLFIAVAEEWKEKHFKTIEYNTIVCYTKPFNDIINYFDKYLIKDITPLLVQNFINSIADKKFSRHTVEVRKIVMHLICSHAVIRGDININPVNEVTIPKNLSKTKVEAPDEDVTDAIIENVNKPFGLYAYFMIYTGCRRSEALALKYEDIDFKKYLIKISKSVVFQGNKPVIKNTPKTKAGNREIILLDELKPKLQGGKGLIFPGKDGLMSHSEVRNNFLNYCNEIGIDVTILQLRHAYATFLYEAGIDEKIAQGQMGHAQISTTKNIYTSIREKHKELARNQLNNYINSSKKVVSSFETPVI